MSDAPIDRRSADWQAVRRRAEAEVEKARDELERHATPQAVTDHLRGRVAAFREVLTWADEPRRPSEPVPGYDV